MSATIPPVCDHTGCLRPWSVSRSAVFPPRLPEPSGRTSELSDALIGLGRRSGLAAVGVTDVAVFEETRADLVERRRRGLDGGMQFTYRNPERSTDPARILAGARALVVGAWSYRHQEPS